MLNSQEVMELIFLVSLIAFPQTFAIFNSHFDLFECSLFGKWQDKRAQNKFLWLYKPLDSSFAKRKHWDLKSTPILLVDSIRLLLAFFGLLTCLFFICCGFTPHEHSFHLRATTVSRLRWYPSHVLPWGLYEGALPARRIKLPFKSIMSSFVYQLPQIICFTLHTHPTPMRRLHLITL